MKKGILVAELLSAFFFGFVVVCSADPVNGKWTWSASSCFQEMTMNKNMMLYTWLACWNDTDSCFDTAEGYGNWQKIENGTYSLTYLGVTDLFLVKGTVGTDFLNRTFLKSITFDKMRASIYSNACP